ncbi:MAG TPA: polysaccharide deacetylase family protein [Gemmatimonadales bacterium]
MRATESPGPDPLRQAIRMALIAAVPRTRLLASLPADDQTVALTFDDGPHPEWTPRILDALARHGARATFFVIGARAAAHPDIVRRLAAEGHAIGHHSWSHSEPATTPARVLLDENRRTRKFLEDLLERPTPLFRPPHGELTPLKLLGAWAQRNVVVLWNRDPKDYQMTAAAELEAAFVARPLKAGDVVLLHDNRAHTAAALPGVLTRCALRCVALGAR